MAGHYLPYPYTRGNMPFKRGNLLKVLYTLHQMVGRIKQALQANEYALGVFFDIEGAFGNTPCQSVKQALDEKKVHKCLDNKYVKAPYHYGENRSLHSDCVCI